MGKGSKRRTLTPSEYVAELAVRALIQWLGERPERQSDYALAGPSEG